MKMRFISALSVLCCVTSVAAVQSTAKQTDDTHVMHLPSTWKQLFSRQAISRAATSMARHFVHIDPLATQRRALGRQSALTQEQVQRSEISQAWAVILIGIIVVIVLFLMSLFLMGSLYDEEEDPKIMQPLHASPAAMVKQPGEYAGVSAASPVRSPQTAAARPVPTSPAHPVISSPLRSQQVREVLASQRSLGMPSSPLRTQQHAPLATQSIWSSGARSNGPPHLCAVHASVQSKTVLKIAKASFSAFSTRGIVEVIGAFNYPVAFARLGVGPEGSRLEVVSQPSWSEVEVTVGPIDFPANLSPDASIHGPHRELYGPFQRTSTGFAVGHYSQAGSVLTLTPKKGSNGIVVAITSGNGQQIATVTEQGSAFQIDVDPGMDVFLVISAVLATFVASQFLIDELYSTI